jgi:hypothetical protein
VSRFGRTEVHLFQDVENWRTLMSWESNPEVISTPMQQAKRQKYIFRRFGFLYHLMGSSAAICVTMGSENPDALGTANGITRGAMVKVEVFSFRLRDEVEKEIQGSGDDTAF